MLGWCVCVREGETMCTPGSLCPLPLSQYVFVSGPGRGKPNEAKQLGFFFSFILIFFRARGFGNRLHLWFTFWRDGGLVTRSAFFGMREFVRSLSLTSWEWIFRLPPPFFPSRSVSIIYSPAGLDLTRLPARIVVVVVLLLPLYVHMCACV